MDKKESSVNRKDAQQQNRIFPLLDLNNKKGIICSTYRKSAFAQQQQEKHSHHSMESKKRAHSFYPLSFRLKFNGLHAHFRFCQVIYCSLGFFSVGFFPTLFLISLDSLVGDDSQFTMWMMLKFFGNFTMLKRIDMKTKPLSHIRRKSMK